MLKIQYDGEDVEHTVAVKDVDYECILTGTSINLDPSDPKLPCMNFDHMTVFKLNENWVQDIYTYFSKEYTINKPVSMGNTLKVDRVINHNFMYHVGPPYIGEQELDFTSIWRMKFTMSPKKSVNTQMWMV